MNSWLRGILKKETIKEKIAMLWFLVRVCGYLTSCLALYEHSKQHTYISTSQYQAKNVQYIPAQMVEIFHAFLTTSCAWLYIAGIFTDEYVWHTAALSTAYLIFDAYEHMRVYTSKGRYHELVKIHEPDKQHTEQAAAFLAHDPRLKLFHHGCTLVFMSGIFFKYDVTGCVLFFQGEFPILLLQLHRCFAYLGLSHTLLAQVCNWGSIVFYFVCRVVMFPLVFSVAMFPYMTWTSLLSWIFVACLFVVWCLNVLSFYLILLSNKLEHRFIQTTFGLVLLIYRLLYPNHLATIAQQSARHTSKLSPIQI